MQLDIDADIVVKRPGTGQESGWRAGQLSALYLYTWCSPEVAMGRPGSIGCIRMRNEDIIELFDLVDVGTGVTINP